jgi:isopropylmalate/homocitrate/citramalate synthase
MFLAQSFQYEAPIKAGEVDRASRMYNALLGRNTNSSVNYLAPDNVFAAEEGMAHWVQDAGRGDIRGVPQPSQ